MLLNANTRPPDRKTIAALRVVARVLDHDVAYVDGERFVFPLGSGWALALTPDDAGRFVVSACYGDAEVARLWCLADDLRRLAELAKALRQETRTTA